MYPHDWIQRWRSTSHRAFDGTAALRDLSPVVWWLGLTSLLTDISSEMVASVLPAYLVLHLRLSPIQYGVVDAIYQGLGVIVAGLAAGVLADRTRRHKLVAATGYALSAACKLLLLLVGGVFGWIAGVLAADRVGKGIRTSPRDALIAANSDPAAYATAFAAHRAMDAAGAMLGPLIGVFLLAQWPTSFDAIWVVSFQFAALGVAAIWLFVPSQAPEATAARVQRREFIATLRNAALLRIAACGFILSLATVSDGFVYLQLQQRGSTSPAWFPLYYVGTSAVFMLLAIPLGRIADRIGRWRVLLAAYAGVLALYGMLLANAELGAGGQIAGLVLMGGFYAGTDGVLVAMASLAAFREARGSGIALLAASVALGKVLSSILFGALWTTHGSANALLVFLLLLPTAIMAAAVLLSRGRTGG